MTIEGCFINNEGSLVDVKFITHDSDGSERYIGDESSGLYFAADDTVTTESGFNDSMDVIIGQSATVNLETDNFAPVLAGRSFRDIACIIDVDGVNDFTGFLEPNTYSQPYVDVLDDLSLNCIDILSALEYCPYGNVGVSRTYDNALRDATTRTFREIIDDAIACVVGTFAKECPISVYYDLSRSLPGKDAKTIFDDLSVSEMAILGDDEDDVMTYKDAVEAVLKYLNLHAVQYGNIIYIFSWESIRKGSVSWYDLKTGISIQMSAEVSIENLRNGIASDTDGEINLSEAFNKLSLKVSPKSIDELVSSPLDNLESAYPKRMRYCTEYYATSEKELMKFIDKGADLETLLEKGEIKASSWIDWYMLIKHNPDWLVGFGKNDLVDTFKTDEASQQDVANRLAVSPAACLMSLGSVKYNDEAKELEDNSPKSSLDMSDYLVISVDEDESGETTKNDLYVPLLEYRGNNGGAVLSPPDSKSVNYIVISGSLLLQKKVNQSITIGGIKDAPLGLVRESAGTYLEGTHVIVNGERNKTVGTISAIDTASKGHRYLLYKWYKKTGGDRTFGNMAVEDLNPQQVTAHPIGWPSDVSGYYSNGLRPPSDYLKEDLQYSYSQLRNHTDTLSKVPVLECMLIIGDKKVKGGAKVLVEDMSMNGSINALKWQTYKTMEECKAEHPDDTTAAEDEYWAQTFSIGFDPKIGDCLLNSEHEIQTNFTWELGIDTDKGMAIPIQYSDHLHGQVDFQILGVVNSYYFDKITKRHRTWFRKEKWHKEAIPLMAQVRNIFIRDFSVKLYSDNAMDGNEGDNSGDLVYTSDTDESFYNKKDDLEFKFHSAFTTDECSAQGLSPVISITTVTETATGDGCLQITDTITGETGKAEALYVSSYYNEMHVSRISLTQSLRDIAKDGRAIVSPWKLYHSGAAGRDFFVQSIERNLREGSATITMKEKF